MNWTMADAEERGSCKWPGQNESVTTYCFGEVSDEERFRFEAHLLDCPHCWAEVQRLDAIIRSVQTNRVTQRFNPDIVSMVGISSRFAQFLAGHWIHGVISSCLFSLMLAVSVFMEVAYQYNQFVALAWKAAPVVFVWSLSATVCALLADLKLTKSGRTTGLLASILVFTGASVLSYTALRPLLPDYPITQANFQTWTAQAAYLKDVVYCWAFTGVFVLVPFHFIITMQRELSVNNYRMPFELLTGSRYSIAPRGAPYVPVWLLGLLLIGGAGYSIVSTAHLLEALRVTEHSNLFILTIQIRWVLFLVLGLECVYWYYATLQELKRECVAIHRLSEKPEKR